MSLAFHPVFTALIAVGPAVLSYWRGRRLLADLHSPTLPERLLALRRSSGPVFGIAVGLLIATSTGRLVWGLPLLVLARMLAAYPLRKALHDETWSVWAYLSFYIRLCVAACGFWLLVAAIPALASRAGTRDWIVAIVLGAIALAWNARYATMFRTLLGAVPVDDPAIHSRFTRLANDCGLSGVTLEQVKLRGGSFTNAVALPSTRTPAVVVTDTLLRYDEDEVAAILAHELAHHEHYNPARLKKANIATWVLIGTGILLPSVVRLAALPGLVLLVWPVVIMIGLILRLQQQQKHETESDLRAVALTGDPEALVRALTKLNESARLPRRWDAEFERHATHPSLARRIQAIRRASGAQSPALTESATFVGAGSAVSATFHSDRLEWREGTSMTHAIDYSSLRELRIDVRSSSTPGLVAVDSMARRWTIPLQTGDIARMQSVLDVIDVHLGKSDAPASTPIDGKRAVSLVVIVAGMAVGHVSLLFTGVLALIQPAPQIAAAAGVSALAAAGFAWRDRALWELGEFSGWLPVALGVAGAMLITMAVASRRETPRGVATRNMVAALAASAVLSWIVVALFGGSTVGFHRSVHEWPSVAILTCACAGALAFDRSRRVRWGGLPVALVGVLAVYGGSTGFVDRFVSDSFVAPAPLVDVKTQTTSHAREFPIDFYPSSLRLSPAGEYLALGSEDEDEQSTIHAGRVGASLAAFTADDAVFAGESTLLLLERQPQESVLRLVDLAESSREVWMLKVPVRWATLSVDRSRQRWRLLGHSADADIISAEGQIGKPEIRQSHWKAPGSIRLQPLAVSSGSVIALHTRHSDTSQLMQLLPLTTLWAFHRAESSMWSLSDRAGAVFGTSNTEVLCHASPAFDQPSTCAAFDGTRTRFFTIDAETRALVPHTSLAGRVSVYGMDDRGWLNGSWDRTPIAVHPATKTAIRYGDQLGGYPYHIAVGRSVLAGIFLGDGTTTIRIHSPTGGHVGTMGID